MKKIEEKMVQAIKEECDLHIDNTTVRSYPYKTDVYLHGNCIATIYRHNIELSSCGWRTVTTKSRLNAILSMYGFYIYQRDFTWYLHNTDNSCSDIQFYDGITIAI